MSTNSDTGTKVLLGATVLMALAMAGIVWFILTGEPDTTDTDTAGSTKPTHFWLVDFFSCDESSFEDDCPTGMMCLGDDCKVEPTDRYCRDGDEAGECLCSSPLKVNHLGICTEKHEPPPPDICREPVLQDALLKIESECKKRKKDIQNCTPKDIKEFLLDHEKFHQVVSAFPGRLALHFPNGKPKKRGDFGWASDEILANYKTELGPFRERLGEAKMIFLVARTSASGSSKMNYEIAWARIDFVNRLLAEILEIEEGQETPIFRPFNLGEAKREMSPMIFRQFYEGAFTTWKPGASANMKAWLGSYDSLGSGSKKWLKEVVNRVVYIIPIPCDMDEIRRAREDAKRPKPGVPAAEPKQAHG